MTRTYIAVAIIFVAGILFLWFCIEYGVGRLSSTPQVSRPPDSIEESLQCPLCGDKHGLMHGPRFYVRRYVDKNGKPVLVPQVAVLMCQKCWDSMDPIQRMNAGIKIMDKKMRDGRGAHDLYYCNYMVISDNLVLAAYGLPQTADIVTLPFVAPDDKPENNKDGKD